MTVNRLIAMTVAMAALLGTASLAGGQGRDPADRGQRLEHDELRSDFRQERLKAPAPLELPPQQLQPKKKSKRSSSGTTR